MMRRLSPLIVLLAVVLATSAWWTSPRPAAPSDCSGALSAPSFCAAVPSAAPEPSASGVFVDQLGPCAGGATAAPTFCLSLPATSPTNDRGVLLAERQQSCAQLETAEAPDFCLALPASGGSTSRLQRDIALALLRQRLGAEFRRAPASGVQLWTEVGVPSAIVQGALRLVAADAAAVQDYFGRSFQQPPAVFLFASQQSFSVALQRHFGVDPAVASQLSRQLLGVLLTGSDAVAINGQSIVTSERPVVYKHELTHVLIHQLAGDSVPPWLDEGVATRVSAIDPAIADPGRAAALEALRTDPRVLSIFTDARDWQTVNAAFGGRAYGVAAEAVMEIERRIRPSGITKLLEALGHGMPFDETFQAIAGETFDDFIARLPKIVRADCERFQPSAACGVSAATTRAGMPRHTARVANQWHIGFQAFFDVIAAARPVTRDASLSDRRWTSSATGLARPRVGRAGPRHGICS